VAINISSYELAFGMDAVTSMKTLLHSPRVMLYEEVGNTEGKSVAVELVQERRSEALRRMIEYQRKMRLAFDQRVSPEVFFNREISSFNAWRSRAKRWTSCILSGKDPFRVVRAFDGRAFKLKTIERSHYSGLEYGASSSLLCLVIKEMYLFSF
jgi:hypothetical protein